MAGVHQRVLLVADGGLVTRQVHAGVGDELAANDVLGHGHHAGAAQRLPDAVDLRDPVGVPHLRLELEVGGRGVGAHPPHERGQAAAQLGGRRSDPPQGPVGRARGRAGGRQLTGGELDPTGRLDEAVTLDLLQAQAQVEERRGIPVPGQGAHPRARGELLALGVRRVVGPHLDRAAALLPHHRQHLRPEGGHDVPGVVLRVQDEGQVGHGGVVPQRHPRPQAAHRPVAVPGQQHHLAVVGLLDEDGPELGGGVGQVVVPVEREHRAAAEVGEVGKVRRRRRRARGMADGADREFHAPQCGQDRPRAQRVCQVPHWPDEEQGRVGARPRGGGDRRARGGRGAGRGAGLPAQRWLAAAAHRPGRPAGGRRARPVGPGVGGAARGHGRRPGGGRSGRAVGERAEQLPRGGDELEAARPLRAAVQPHLAGRPRGARG